MDGLVQKGAACRLQLQPNTESTMLYGVFGALGRTHSEKVIVVLVLRK